MNPDIVFSDTSFVLDFSRMDLFLKLSLFLTFYSKRVPFSLSFNSINRQVLQLRGDYIMLSKRLSLKTMLLLTTVFASGTYASFATAEEPLSSDFDSYLRSGNASFYVSAGGLSGKVQYGDGSYRGITGECFFVASDGCALIGSSFNFDGETITCYVKNTLCYSPTPYAFEVDVNPSTRRVKGFRIK